MASANDCLRAIDAAAKGELSDDELQDLIETLDRIRKERGAGDDLRDLESSLFDEAGIIAEDAELAAQIEKRNRLKNIVVKGRLLDIANRAHAQLGDASLGLEAVMVGINSKLEGGRLSVDARGNGLLRGYMGGMIADLRKENLHGVYARGELDREIARELWDLSRPKPDGKASTSADAKKIAAIVHKFRRGAVLRENRAGAHIRFIDGYVTRQTHDRARMERAGRDAWVKIIDAPDSINWDAMRVPANRRQNFLTAAYEALVTGVRKDAPGGAESDLMFAFKGPGNLAKKASAERVILFKSADAWFDYNEKFGRRDLREAINDDFRRAAQNTALMEGLGTNPEAMFKAVRDELKKKHLSDPKQVRRLERRSLDWFMAEIDGSVNNASSHSMAAFGRTFRAIQSMAKLGGAFIASIADIAAVASERRFQGRSLMDSWLDAFRAPIEGFTAGAKRRYGEMLGVGIDGMLGNFTARFAAQDDVPGKTSKLMSLFFKLNLLGPWTDAVKRGTGMMMARDLAMMAEGGFDALSARTRRNLAQYGIDANKWELARLLVEEGPDGRMYMLPNAEVDAPQFKGRKGQRLRDEVRESLSAYINDRVEFASPTPGARERGYIRRGTIPGDIDGEAIRFLMQFKSFPITVISRVQGRDVYSNGARRLKDAFLKGEGDMLGLANYIAGATILGYIAMQAKELAKGRELRENDMQTFFAAALQGGGFGIYGDFLIGEKNRFGKDLFATAAGPSFGLLADVKEIQLQLQEGQDVGASTLRIIQSNIPGANLFYTKAAMDYLIYYQLQEIMNPGYLGRMERRIKKENGQRYFVPPSKAVPRGGGSRLFEGVR